MLAGARLKLALAGHAVKTVPETGWRSSKDGPLLRFAEKNFDVFVTIDQKMEREQDLRQFAIGFVVARVKSNRLEDFALILSDMRAVIAKVRPGQVIHLETPGSEGR
ncbi:MAG TPA: hypothetical protein VMT15_00400 [Bryobacteraceae bacterium]|nr:hypothetical protein [Bryobacteraceae bacterium]